MHGLLTLPPLHAGLNRRCASLVWWTDRAWHGGAPGCSRYRRTLRDGRGSIVGRCALRPPFRLPPAAGRVHIYNSTLGKALGGAMGGYTSAAKPVVNLLRQRARPYLFSNTLPPAVVGATLKVFDMLLKGTSLVAKARVPGPLARPSLATATQPPPPPRPAILFAGASQHQAVPGGYGQGRLHRRR